MIHGPMTLDLRLWADRDGPRRGLLALWREGGYVLEGALEGKQVRGRIAKVEAKDSPPMSRGFHWINEKPFNRRIIADAPQRTSARYVPAVVADDALGAASSSS